MAPGGAGKRKRGDRTQSGDARDDARPSPHRPEQLRLGQHDTQHRHQPFQNHGGDPYDQRGGGRRRGSWGGRGGRGAGSQQNSPHSQQFQARSTNPALTSDVPPQIPPQPKAEPIPNTSAEPDQQSELAAAQEQPSVQENLTPYSYEYLNDEIVAAWAENGRSAIVRLGVEANERQDFLALGVLFQELVSSGFRGRVDPAEVGSAIRDILGQYDESQFLDTGDSSDAISLFLDNLSIMAELDLSSPSLVTMAISTGISPVRMRRELDSSLLENLGLVRKSVFVRMGIRQQTNLLYRQSNYNLAREETEGYSKLMTDLFTTSSDQPPTSEVVEETFERVKGMIGAFDLDVGRVLDVALDVFATVLVKQYRFFVKYFRASSWWPHSQDPSGLSTRSLLGPLPRWALPGSSGGSLNDEEKETVRRLKKERHEAFWVRAKEVGMAAFFELGDRQIENSSLDAAMKRSAEASSIYDEAERKWIELTRTLPPPGNKVAAQVLGFKLRYYTSSARDQSETLPVNLIYLAALLIKVGFISLKDLYPHVWPDDESMEKMRDEKFRENAEKEKLNRPGGGVPNALLSAAPLPDDTIDPREAMRQRDIEAVRRHTTKANSTTDRSTPNAQAEGKEEELPEPAEQKVQLLKSLLCVGALPEALYMLGRYPWLTEAFSELPDYIHRILHHSLSSVYESLRPLQDQSDLQEQMQIPATDQSGIPKGQIKLTDAPPRKRKRWAQLDQDNVNEKDEVVDYRFYWDEWADIVPVCQTIDDVFTLCSTLLNLTGVRIGQDPTLLIKLSRIGNSSLARDPSTANTTRWIDLSKRILVPALSFTKCNPGVVNEVFDLIKNFSHPVRYNIYAEWYSGQTSRQSDLKTAFEQAKAETKDVLKRMSKTTLKPMARALAKVAYANPGIVFQVAIAQLESYENIVDAVVECARYFTYLAYDVLTWSLLSALSGRGRNRVQADGMLTSKWLAALSLFAGKVFKRYSVLNPTPVIQYVADQLRQANSTDLIVLEEITKSMAGIVSDSSFNEAQVVAMAGGDVLKAQTMLQLLDKRHESRTTAKRLMKSLTDSRLVGQVIVSLAQERQTCIYKIEEQNAHPKLLGNLFDQLHRIFIQYNELIRGNLTITEFDNFVPSVVELVASYGVEPNIAFWIGRPSITSAMTMYDVRHGKRISDVKEVTVKESMDMEGSTDEGQTTKADDLMKIDTASSEDLAKEESKDSTMEDSTSTATDAKENTTGKTDAIFEPWHPVLKEIMTGVEPALPSDTWKALSPAFYVTFWQCSLGDMVVPFDSYEEEIKRQGKKIAAINADRSDLSIIGTQRKDREKKGLTDLQDRLRKESRERLQVYSQSRQRLNKEKQYWFANSWGKWDDLNVALLEQCFFPRLTLSAVDALYTFKMLKFLHSSGAVNFRTMGIYDQLFREQRLTSMMFLCSAKEAECFGRFLNEVLRDLSKWHSDKGLFEKEAYGSKKDLPGFAKKLSNDKTQHTFFDYEDFRRVLYKWHRDFSNALRACLTSKEYMHIRNAINILNTVHQNFPVVNYMGKQIMASITDLGEKESREDLKIAAASLMGALKRREKDWVLPQAFQMVDIGAKGTNTGRSSSTKVVTPQPEGDAMKNLNPKAPEFQPSPQLANSNARSVAAANGKLDAEDGEIEDSLMTDARKGAVSTHQEKTESATVADAAQVTKAPAAAPRAASFNEQERSMTPEKGTAATKTSQPSKDRPPQSATLPSHPSVPAKPDISKTMATSAVNGRTQHDLPSRPESSQSRSGEYRPSGRPSDRTSHDQQRESRYPDRPPFERPRDSPRSSSDRPAHGTPVSNTERLDGGSRLNERERFATDNSLSSRLGTDDRHGSPMQGEARQSVRGERIAQHTSTRVLSSNDQPPREALPRQHQPRDVHMPPPRSAAPLQQDRAGLNPERAALIHGSQEAGRGVTSERYLQETQHANPGDNARSLPQPQYNDRTPSFDDRRDGRRPDGGYRNGDAPSVRPRFDDSHAPTGPRMDRAGTEQSIPSNDRYREPQRPNHGSGRSFESGHGRLNQDTGRNGRQTESQYGRLNAGHDAPSGPRMPNGTGIASRGGRDINSASQPQLGTQQPPHDTSNLPSSSTMQERYTANGPATRGPIRGNMQTIPPIATQESPGPDVTGVHPDRLKAIQGLGGSSGNVTSSDRDDMNGGNRQPPANATSAPTPSRMSTDNHMEQSPIDRGGPGPPTGPAVSIDRGRDKRFAGLQGVLQQNGPVTMERSGQGASIRGRGGRNMPSPSGPSGGFNSSAPDYARQDVAPARDDLFAGRTNGPPPANDGAQDVMYGRGMRRGPPPREEPRENERRSVGYGNRGPPQERPPSYQDEKKPPLREDPRERYRMDEGGPHGSARGRGRGQGQDMRGPPLPPPERDLRGGPPVRRPGRDEPVMDRRSNQEGEFERRGGGGGGNDDRRDGNSGSLRKRGRAGEEGPTERVMDSKRTRR